ncbi:MAG: superoxide dismutase [Burkholderiales bacterium]|nr:superoxide dismutase [Phycisphaerae bacterium]
MLAAAQKDGVYSLPKLPYEYAALEPHIDAQTMELHHSKHHAAYVTNLNKAIDSLAKLRDEPEIDAAKLSALSRDISFNAGGHILHTVFFGTMTDQTKPGGGGGGDGDGGVHGAINSQYGSLDKFKTHFTKVAAGVKGSGWAIAWYEPVADKILITESGDQDLRMIPGGMPILLIDVWEHAYYLKHQNKRADYISAWWNVVRWSEVDNLYRNVKSMTRRM